MTDLSDGRVIITYGRSLMALTAARSLASRGVEVIGTDDVDFNALSFSKWSSHHELHAKASSDPERFIADMVRIVRDHKPDDDRPYVLMPMFTDAKLLAEHADQFAGEVLLAAPPIEAISMIDPKDVLARTARRINLSAPKSFACATEDEMEEAAAEVRYPCLVKPADEVGGRGITKVADTDALRAAWASIRRDYPEGDPVVQELAKGDDYCYCALAINGEIVADMAYRNLVSYPADYGAGVVRETIDHHRFRTAAAPLLREAGWSGVGEIDFMWTGDEADEPLLIELNPRFWANLDHSVSSGIDFPWLLYESTVTAAISETPQVKIGHRSKLPGLWLLAALEQSGQDDAQRAERSAANAEILARLRGGHVPAALKAFAEEPNSGLGLRQAFQNLKARIQGAQEIDTIAADQDDPLVGLGVFFVLGSLLRYGELPPELRR